MEINQKYLHLVKGTVKLSKVALFIFTTSLFIGSYLTISNSDSPNQRQFVKGVIPNPLPDDFYKGSADIYTGPWLGKRFDSKTGTGINVFEWRGRKLEYFPFLMYKGDGIRDEGLNVLKIDYNIPENPFWLRPALDEVVEIAPGRFLGKLNYRYSATGAFTLLFFNQERQSPVRN